jgi:hypothetical protein
LIFAAAIFGAHYAAIIFADIMPHYGYAIIFFRRRLMLSLFFASFDAIFIDFRHCRCH